MAQLDVTGRSYVAGPLSVLNKETDGTIFIPGIDFAFTGTTVTQTRTGAGQYAATAPASGTTNFGVMLNSYFLNKTGTDPALGTKASAGVVATGDAMRAGSLASNAPIPAGLGHDIRGARITGISVVYRQNTGSATSITPSLNRSVWTTGAAIPTPTQPTTLTGSMTLTSSANAIVFPVVVTTPFIVGNNTANTIDTFELIVVNPASNSTDLFGIFVVFDYNIL